MGLLFTYATIQPVPRATADALAQEALGIAPPRGWWCEGITLVPSDHPQGRLSGSSKLFLAGYSASNGYRKVKPDDDFAMAFADAMFIIHCLASWSRRFGMRWDIGAEGEHLGFVGPLGLNLRARAIAVALGAFARFGQGTLFLGRRVGFIASEHSDRSLEGAEAPRPGLLGATSAGPERTPKPCPKCGQPLRSSRARQCPHCGADWH